VCTFRLTVVIKRVRKGSVKVHRTEYGLALVSRKGIGKRHCRVYTAKKISVPRNLLLNSEEIGPKKQWQTKNCRFLKVLEGKSKKRQIKFILAVRVRKGGLGWLQYQTH